MYGRNGSQSRPSCAAGAAALPQAAQGGPRPVHVAEDMRQGAQK